jgi:hypothetical protein
MSNTAGIDYRKVGTVGHFDLAKPDLFEKFSNLLALILVDFTAKGIYGKGLHNMI